MKVYVHWVVISTTALLGVLAISVYLLNPWGASDWDVVERLFGVQVYRQPSASMEPTIQSGEFFLARGYRVDADCYFVMNDNREFTGDSREYGCIPRASIIGKVSLK